MEEKFFTMYHHCGTTMATEVKQFYFHHRGSTAALPANDLADYWAKSFKILLDISF